MTYHYVVPGDDFTRAGNVSAEMKKTLQMLGIPTQVVKRTAVAMYESEINMVVHAGGGEATIEITDDAIIITMQDHGPGIPDVEKAMEEGFSTASETIRELGFGAGMGLPNMKRNSDNMTIETSPQTGTKITMTIDIK